MRKAGVIGPGLLLRAVRAPSLVTGALPALVGAAWVASKGWPVDAGALGLTLLGLVCAQAAVNVVNDLFDDLSGLDADPDFAASPFPLGSRVLQEGSLGRPGMWALCAACSGLALACALRLDALHPGHVVLGLALAGALLGFAYTAPPLRIAYRGAGEPVVFLLFGPLAGGGAIYVQTGWVDAGGWLLASVVGWLAMAVLYLHHFPQREADARHGKRTPVVRLGARGAGRLVPALLAAPFLALLVGVAAGVLPWPALASLAGTPFALRASRIALRRAEHPRAMAAAFTQVMGALVFGAGALAAGLWLS